jgi:chromosome segregation ATPase
MEAQDPENVINIIHEIQREGQISDQTANVCREKFIRVHELLMQNLENEKKLVDESRILKQQLSQEIQKLEQAQNNQKVNEDTLKDLTEKINNFKKEIDAVEDRIAVLHNDIQTLQNDKADLENDLRTRKERERERLIPEIENMKEKIKELKALQEKNAQLIERKQEDNKRLEEENHELELKASQKEQNEKLSTEFLNIKNDPDRWAKKNKSFENEVGVLANQVKAIQDSIKKLDEKKAKIEEAIKIEEEIAELERKKDQKDSQISELQDRSREKEKIMNENLTKKIELDRERNETERQIKLLKEDRRNATEKKSQLTKDIELQKRSYKKTEFQLNNYLNTCKEHENKIGATTKMFEEKMKEHKQQQEYDKKVYEENQLFFGVLVSKRIEEKKMDADKKNILDQIDKLEEQVEKLREEETKLVEEIKFLSTIREKMARTASQAMAQARETKEELKVKELLILDLNKKFQETEFRLNSFVALYEEVRNARNKYVSLIQNSSQDLAEMKERIKILQNEVEILRNECSEKDRDLVDIKHNVTIAVYKRDSQRAELNKCDFKCRNKQSISGQKVNEGDKLNLIINSLEKDMNNLTNKYEAACGHRNYMGIQLIDRNDELCILYEKSNIHENILKNGEQEIREREEEIRMLNLEFKERQRQLEVIRKKVPEVPELAKSVASLKSDLQKAKERVYELSEKLEDPDMHPIWKSLAGEDPDEEQLKAKIQVLEERLNNKKEMLLEKELVCEEVSNLAEKLRKQALDGRKSTLEIAERINEFKARTTELSRKMLATVSELSMFQSKALKLQEEKDRKEDILESSIQRLEQGEPPTDDCEREWDRMEKNRDRQLQENEIRRQRKQLEKQLPLMGVKTHAVPRPNNYMRPDLDIPRPYGHHPPFKPSEPGASMRHILKPTKKPIET